jgi:hypothetical protein
MEILDQEKIYCGSDIVNESPEEFLDVLTANSPQESAIIDRRLDSLRDLPLQNWPPKWVKQINKNSYQLTAADHRVYLGIYERKLVVFFICRKVGNKAKPKDIKRARLNQEAYEKWIEGDR